MKYPIYTLQEDNILKENYGKILIIDIIKKFKLDRTPSSIRARAYVLKLISNLNHSPQQIEKMRIKKTKKVDKKILKMSDDLAYIIGVLNGDGYIFNYTTGLAVTDKSFAVYFKKVLERWSGLKVNFYEEKNDNYTNGILYRVGLGSIIIKKFFMAYCSAKNSKAVKNIKEDLIEKSHKIEFINGFFDSEGSIMKSKDRKMKIKYFRIAFSNSNLELIKLIQQILKELKFSSKYYSEKAKFNEIRGRKFWSERKYTLYLNVSNSKLFSQFLKTTIKRKFIYGNFRE